MPDIAQIEQNVFKLRLFVAQLGRIRRLVMQQSHLKRAFAQTARVVDRHAAVFQLPRQQQGVTRENQGENQPNNHPEQKLE